MQLPIITLTTDFGAHGPYVAAMKGVILRINPTVQLVDVSHEIGPQNVREAALMLRQIVPYFAAGTIHVVVVDPGVGTERRLLGVEMHGQVFLAPDNGVLSWAARGAASVRCTELTEPRFWLRDVSATFQGRDILAPVAANLSLGVAMHELGRAVPEWVQSPWPEPVAGTRWLDGEVLAIDRFGNAVTNISGSALRPLIDRAARVICGGREMGGIVRTYSDAKPGEPLALVGSSGLLEIAVRDGNAAERLGIGPGERVRIEW